MLGLNQILNLRVDLEKSKCSSISIYLYKYFTILQRFTSFQSVHFSLSKHLSITSDTPSRFVSQLHILIRTSNDVDRRRECEAASRAGAGSGRMSSTSTGRMSSMDFQTYDFIQLIFSSYIEIGSASINIIRQMHSLIINLVLECF